jgi:uncharacterized membrane protein (UPF0127 family)
MVKNNRYRLAFALAVCALASLSCAGKAQRRLPETVISVKGNPIKVEIARSEKQQEMGLMYRKRLDEGKGMIFVFPSDRQLSFWMKNTYLPLSIAFLSSSGKIEELFDMEPLSEESVRTMHYVRYALEVPRGYFKKIGAEPGDVIDLSALR